MPRLLTFSALVVLLGSRLSGQSEDAALPVAMPADRIAASYAIYSQLLPVRDPRDPWGDKTALIAPVTADAAGPGESCSPRSPDLGSFTNPHHAVHPPISAYRDLWEILDDFDAHCHERFRLSAENLHSSSNLRVLTQEEVREFVSVRGGSRLRAALGPELIRKYNDASALYTFSTVFFNQHRTIALVHVALFYGSLGAQGSWIAFSLINGRWKPIHWSSDSYMA